MLQTAVPFDRSADDPIREFYGAQRISEHVINADQPARCFIFENFTLDEFSKLLGASKDAVSAFDLLLGMYQPKRSFPDLGNFRLGPNSFDKIPLDWIALVAEGQSTRSSPLIGHGVMTRIPWDRTPESLPRGWQGTVRFCHENASGEQEKCNTFIGLFIRVEDSFREGGHAGKILEYMRLSARNARAESLIIPLRLPTRFTRDLALMPFDDFARRRRSDGQYADHWLRLHTRAGAKILTNCHASHEHAMNLEDFQRIYSVAAPSVSGYHLVELNGEWFNAFVDIDRDFALIRQECVWVEHQI